MLVISDVVSDLQLGDTDLANMLGAFFPGYMITQIPSGPIIQKYGGKPLLLLVGRISPEYLNFQWRWRSKSWDLLLIPTLFLHAEKSGIVVKPGDDRDWTVHDASRRLDGHHRRREIPSIFTPLLLQCKCQNRSVAMVAVLATMGMFQGPMSPCHGHLSAEWVPKVGFYAVFVLFLGVVCCFYTVSTLFCTVFVLRMMN